jgi:hypothetical protein
LILLSFLISRGERPRTPYDATCGDEQMGEANRVLPGSHKSAEPVEAGRPETSASGGGPACESAMERATEPMADAPSEHVPRRRGSGRVGRQAGEALGRTGELRTGGMRATARQPSGEPARLGGRISHGVKSAPTADERSLTEPENLAPASSRLGTKTIEATDDRGDEGRSLRSSPGTGKPFTW